MGLVRALPRSRLPSHPLEHGLAPLDHDADVALADARHARCTRPSSNKTIRAPSCSRSCSSRRTPPTSTEHADRSPWTSIVAVVPSRPAQVEALTMPPGRFAIPPAAATAIRRPGRPSVPCRRCSLPAREVQGERGRDQLRRAVRRDRRRQPVRVARVTSCVSGLPATTSASRSSAARNSAFVVTPSTTSSRSAPSRTSRRRADRFRSPRPSR